MPPKYQPVIIKGVNDKKLSWQEELARIKEREAYLRWEKRQQNLRAPRRRRTTRYSRTDFEFFDRVEELYKLTKAQLIEHIIRLEDSLEHLQ